MINIESLVRKNILSLKPYASARDEFSGEAKVFLDANENSLGSPTLKWYNRYPDPHQRKLKEAISVIKQVDANKIFIGNGSDECIDVLLRVFCEPQKDNIIICPPTYGMYEVSANINNIEIRRAPLLADFQLNLAHIETLVDANTKMIWLCSPNNPTGNSLHRADIEMVLNNFNGIVVIDEAYINFSQQKSFVQELAEYENLVVTQTLSKAWGLASLRLGMTFASEDILRYMNKVKPPYNIGGHTQEIVLKALEEVGQVNDMINEIVQMREALKKLLSEAPFVEQVYASDANFLLVKMKDARKIYEYLLTQGIVLRDRSNVQLIENCLRITVGSEKENTLLVDALIAYQNSL